MKILEGWEGPKSCGKDFRYSKSVGWTSLYIIVRGSEVFGGAIGPGHNFEIVLESRGWVRYENDLALDRRGEVQLVIQGGTTWAVQMERISEEVISDPKIEGLEDLAAYLENSVRSR